MFLETKRKFLHHDNIVNNTSIFDETDCVKSIKRFITLLSLDAKFLEISFEDKFTRLTRQKSEILIRESTDVSPIDTLKVVITIIKISTQFEEVALVNNLVIL